MNTTNTKNLFSFVALTSSFLLTISCHKNNPPGGGVTPAQNVQETPIERMQKTVLAAPSYDNYVQLGLEFAKMGRGQEAHEAYNKAVAINPAAPLAWNNICAQFNVDGKYLEAIPNCEKAISLDPKFELAKNNLKAAQEHIAEIKNGLTQKKSKILTNKNAPANELIDLGMDYYNLHDYVQAAEVWSKINTKDSMYAAAQNNLASAYIMAKQYSKAEKSINEALKLDPNNQRYVNNKNWLESAKKGSK